MNTPVRESSGKARFRRRVRRPHFEQLESRSLLAIDVALSGTEVTFTDVGPEIYPLEVSVNELGQLQYNLRTTVDGELISEVNSIDLDTSQPGIQSLQAADATRIDIDLTAGGGGGAIRGIRSGAISFAGGGLAIDWSAYSADSRTTFSASGLTRTEPGFTLTAIVPTSQELVLLYGEGDDTVLAASFAASLNATTSGGNDVVIGTDQPDFISAGAGNDYLDGRGGDDSLSADESLIPGNDTVCGHHGDDTIYAGLGNDRVFGGSGFDYVTEELAGGRFHVTRSRLNVDGFITRNHGIESFIVVGTESSDNINASAAVGPVQLFGMGGNDRIIGSGNDDLIEGGEGNDLIEGRGGNDELSGGGGDDSVDGGAGDDGLAGQAGEDLLTGGRGDDLLSGGDDADQLNGGAGNDYLNGNAGSDTVLGGDGQDTLSEDADPAGLGDTLDGGGDDDVLLIYGGNNTLRGGAGNDRILAGDFGIDAIFGDGGDDLLVASLADTFAGGAGTDTLTLVTGLTTARITNSTITFDGVSRPRAGLEVFSLFAIATAVFDASGYTAGSVEFHGSDGDDVLIGSQNADLLLGRGGADTLEGRGGRDLLRGDADDATVLGGAGIDDFGFFGLYEAGLPESHTRQDILDLLFDLGIAHDIAANELLEALVS